MAETRRLRLALVTGNKHKLREAQEILSPYGIDLYMAGPEKIEIQADSLSKIAMVAARHAWESLGKPLIVDDSGLFIEALNGFPGPYSRYVYDTLGVDGILKLLEGEENRHACFKTAVALVLPPLEMVFEGKTCGTITTRPKGSSGFGFDPIFVPEGCSRTYAEMTVSEKNKVSHRAKAMKTLGSFIKSMF
ncbi:MAG: XTP/dITP diphosphatase [Desulfurococcales archaeon]|nr:XTP/dITP diphosphatase [Desulfurococcales archaeon]